MEALVIYEHKPPISTEEAVEYTYKVVRHDVASLPGHCWLAPCAHDVACHRTITRDCHLSEQHYQVLHHRYIRY